MLEFAHYHKIVNTADAHLFFIKGICSSQKYKLRIYLLLALDEKCDANQSYDSLS